MATSNAEDYLRAIYRLCGEGQTKRVPTGEIARHLALTPGSVTGMLQRMEKSGLVDYVPHKGARLTSTGRKVTLKIVRRHRLIELFLVKSLGMSWDEVHEEADLLEHSASDHLIDRIDEYLGRPECDPHGDPIPNAQGQMTSVDAEPLANCQANVYFDVRQVDDSAEELLRYLREGGLGLGSQGKVLRNDSAAGIIEIKVGTRKLAISREAAASIFVQRCEVPTPGK
jgi:DtxR family Mn-dependent transcriptional regulator